MGKSTAPSTQVPQYNAPANTNFNTPYGSATFDSSTNSYNYTENPGDSAFRLELEALRGAILKTIGVTSADREASRQSFTDAYYKEATRLAVPKMENTLFDRGLGGSKLYGQSLNDLNSQLTNDSIMAGEQLRMNDEATKLNNLNAVSGAMNQQNQLPLSLLSLASNYNTNQQQLAQQQYNNLLPYQSIVTPGKQSNTGTYIGAGIGGLVGLAGGPMGALQGAAIGSNFNSIFS